MITEALVLAGGFGSRMTSQFHGIPKVMGVVNKRPFLEYVFDYLIKQGIKRVVLSTGYLSVWIKTHFDHHYKSLEIVYSQEDNPLGTGGAIRQAMDLIERPDFLLVYGDTLFKTPVKKLYQMHHSRKADLTIALKRVPDTTRYGRVDIDGRKRITGFREKYFPEKNKRRHLINGGYYIVNKRVFENTNLSEHFCFTSEFIPNYYRLKKMYGFVSTGYFIDIGAPADYVRACGEIK